MTPRPAAARGGAPLREALEAQRPLLRRAAWLSSAIGTGLLLPSWYMFEVYGRVLDSRNLATLAWLLVMVLGVYAMVELLDHVRGRLLAAAAARFDARLRQRLYDAAFDATLRRASGSGLQAFADLKTLREFIASPTVVAVLDLPAALLCVLLLFLMGPWLGAIALASAVLQLGLITLTERRTMPLLTRAIAASIQAQQFAAGALRNAQVIEAMGMLGRVRERWLQRQNRFLAQQGQASDYAGITAAAARLLQSMQGSVLLGGACWVMLHGGLWGGSGMIIVASILGGRALQPLAQMVPLWRSVIQARDAQARLAQLFAQQAPRAAGLPLPAPAGLLSAEAATAAAPGTQVPILRNVSFVARPGELTLVIGPTASGKSTLARLLVGVWPAHGGSVRLDGADVHAWNKQELGPHVGYLPQAVELFDGTVAENVARFGDIDRAAVDEALAQAGLAELVAALPDGADTRIGDDGAVLSGGQRQRLGLARALYRNPRLLVLDEPNSSLDAAGDQQLLALMGRLKARGATVVAITHRSTLLPAADRILMLRDGQVAAFGPRDEVMAALAKANEKAAEQARAAQAARAGAARLPAGPGAAA